MWCRTYFMLLFWISIIIRVCVYALINNSSVQKPISTFLEVHSFAWNSKFSLKCITLKFDRWTNLLVFYTHKHCMLGMYCNYEMFFTIWYWASNKCEHCLLQNIKLHYVESGDSSKPLMLFLHGYPEFWYSWRHQIVEFSKDYW